MRASFNTACSAASRTVSSASSRTAARATRPERWPELPAEARSCTRWPAAFRWSASSVTIAFEASFASQRRSTVQRREISSCIVAVRAVPWPRRLAKQVLSAPRTWLEVPVWSWNVREMMDERTVVYRGPCTQARREFYRAPQRFGGPAITQKY